MKNRKIRYILFFILCLLIFSVSSYADDSECPKCGKQGDKHFNDIFSCAPSEAVSQPVESFYEYICENDECENYLMAFSYGSEVVHDGYIEKEYVSASCINEGYTRYECVGCGDSYTVKHAAFGHKYEVESKTDATCLEPGLITRKCTVCSDAQKEIIKALGHDLEQEIKEASCTGAGYIKESCKRCQYEDEKLTAVLGHDYEEKVTEASCIEAGKKESICRRCGDYYEEDIAAKGHDFGEWIVVSGSTYTSEGKKVRTCSVCSLEESLSIPKKFPVVIAGGVSVVAAVAGYYVFKPKTKKLFKLKELPSRKVCFILNEEDNEILNYFKLRKYINTEVLRAKSYEDYADKIWDKEPSLIVVNITKDRSLDDILELIGVIKEKYRRARFSVLADEVFLPANEERLNELERNGDILNWASCLLNKEKLFVKLILPIYMNDITFDKTMKSLGKWGDLLGIPYVSTIASLYKEGKNIYKNSAGGDVDIFDAADITGSIAAILGFEKIEEAAGLFEDLEKLKKLNKDTGAYEVETAVDAGKDILETVSDLLS